MNYESLKKGQSLVSQIEHEEKNLRVIAQLKKLEKIQVTGNISGCVTVPDDLKDVFILCRKYIKRRKKKKTECRLKRNTK